jgi:hypothetical protein
MTADISLPPGSDEESVCRVLLRRRGPLLGRRVADRAHLGVLWGGIGCVRHKSHGSPGTIEAVGGGMVPPGTPRPSSPGTGTSSSSWPAFPRSGARTSVSDAGGATDAGPIELGAAIGPVTAGLAVLEASCTRGAAAHIHVIYDVSATADSPLIPGARFTRPAAAGGDCRPGGCEVDGLPPQGWIERRPALGRWSASFVAGSVEWWILLDALRRRFFWRDRSLGRA